MLRLQVQDTRTKLYKLHEGQGFQLEAAGTEPHFYDINEDSSGVPPRWYLEVNPSQLWRLSHFLGCPARMLRGSFGAEMSASTLCVCARSPPTSA